VAWRGGGQIVGGVLSVPVIEELLIVEGPDGTRNSAYNAVLAQQLEKLLQTLSKVGIKPIK